MSQLIVRELGTREPQLVSQIVTIIQDERQVQDEEATMLVELFRRDLDQWDSRPAMSDYCGAKEDDGVFLIHQVRNRDGTCGIYECGPSPCRSCINCCHRLLGSGPVEDQQILEELRSLAIGAAPVGMSPSTQEMSNHIQLIGAIKSLEAAQAYYAGRFLFEPPKYLSTCAIGSLNTESVLCVIRNPDDVCMDWVSYDSCVDKVMTQDEIRDDAATDFPSHELLERLKTL